MKKRYIQYFSGIIDIADLKNWEIISIHDESYDGHVITSGR